MDMLTHDYDCARWFVVSEHIHDQSAAGRAELEDELFHARHIAVDHAYLDWRADIPLVQFLFGRLNRLVKSPVVTHLQRHDRIAIHGGLDLVNLGYRHSKRLLYIHILSARLSGRANHSTMLLRR